MKNMLYLCIKERNIIKQQHYEEGICYSQF